MESDRPDSAKKPDLWLVSSKESRLMNISSIEPRRMDGFHDQQVRAHRMFPAADISRSGHVF